MRAGRALRAAGGIAVALLLFELGLRHIYSGLPTWDPQVGWVYRNTELHRYIFEGWATSHWDRQGIREIPGEVPPGHAILVVGNSVTQAAQVGDADVYTAILQSRLGMPVLNVGHDAQGIADDVFAARHHVATLPVAWTIVQFVPLDFQDKPPKADHAGFLLAGDRLVAEPSAAPRRGRLTPTIYWLRRHSALINFGLLRYAVLQATPMPPLFRAADPLPPDPPVAYGPVEMELNSVRDAYGGRVTMFLVPDFLPPETTMERRFTQWCKSSDASCVNLRSVFEEFRRRGRAPTGFPNSGFGLAHLNREGHVAAADLLTQELKRLRGRGLF